MTLCILSAKYILIFLPISCHLFMCTGVLPENMLVHYVCIIPGESRRGHWISCNWSHSVNYHVGTELRSSARTESVLKHWTTFSVHFFLFTFWPISSCHPSDPVLNVTVSQFLLWLRVPHLWTLQHHGIVMLHIIERHCVPNITLYMMFYMYYYLTRLVWRTEFYTSPLMCCCYNFYTSKYDYSWVQWSFRSNQLKHDSCPYIDIRLSPTLRYSTLGFPLFFHAVLCTRWLYFTLYFGFHLEEKADCSSWVGSATAHLLGSTHQHRLANDLFLGIKRKTYYKFIGDKLGL